MFTPAPLKDFSEDKLNLKSFADDLTNIVMSPLPHPTNEYSKVIALDSGWGTGKTSFINMWTKKLETDSKFICLPYNAWENDDSPDALIPILCSFQKLINEDTPKGQKLKGSLANIISTFGSKFFGLITQLTFGTNLEGFAEASKEYWEKKQAPRVEAERKGFAEAIKEYWEKKLPDMIFDEFTNRQKHKELFWELTENIRGECEYLLICIDELDRCRPTFAIETLEVVKHFFDIPNVVFVFSLDMQQLSKSIKTIYGDIDSMGYLQRFFDYIIPLPKQELKSFLEDRLPQQYSSDVDLLSRLAKRFSISLRALNGICVAYCQFNRYINEINVYLNRSSDPFAKVKLYLLFIAMKYSHPEMYLSLLRNGSSDEPGREILEFIGAPSYWSKYTKECANLIGTNNYDEWKKAIDFFLLVPYTDYSAIYYENNRDEPIYKLIDKSINEIIEKS